MTVIDTLTEDCRQAGVAPDLLMMAGFVLAQLYEEEPIGAIETYCRTLARNGQTWADENKVLRSLQELRRVGLVQEVGGIWTVREKEVKKVKKQRTLLDEFDAV